MKNAVNKLLISASIAAGMSAISSAPAHAISFTFNNPNEINTYTGGSDGKFIKEDTAAAVKALNDKDSSSNVELWYSTENPTSNVGFTAKQGKYSATVSSVTSDDWNNFGSQWLGDLLSNYTPFKSVWNGFSADSKSLVTSYFPSLGMGDPNIGGFQFGQNGGLELKLVGHLDVKTKLATTISTKVDEKWNAIKSQFPQQTTLPTLSQVESSISQFKTQLNIIPNTPFFEAQKKLLTDKISELTSFKDVLTLKAALNGYEGEIAASEIAKVITGDKTYYAYSFNPTASGITASDDGVSYNAIYTWKTKEYVPKKTPEPSVMLGMLGLAGVFAVQRKRKKATV